MSNTGHLGTPAPGVAAGDSEDGEEEAEVVTSPKTAKKKRKTLSPTRNDITKSMKSVYTPILSTVGLFRTILERANGFIVANEIDHRLLFTLSAASLSILSIDASPFVRADTTSLASIVQVSSMDLLVSIFRRYPRHRSIIIEDLFPLMLKLPTSKRSLRTFLVKKRGGYRAITGPSVKAEATAATGSGESEYIQPICALVLLFVQSCVTMPL